MLPRPSWPTRPRSGRATPKVIGNWIDELRAQGVSETSCHHIREIRPGVLLTACQPFAAISVNAADGGSPEHPKVLYTGEAAKFVHSARWPRQGQDKFVLIGGEKNFTGRCELNDSEFSVYSAQRVLSGAATQFDGAQRDQFFVRHSCPPRKNRA